ncbi:MAG: hypothetical protein K5841_09045 [Fretibacterium sp.]|nr:hypothetical protein [Fretibacterium sp.]
MPRLRRTVERTSPKAVDEQDQTLERQMAEAVDTMQPVRPVEIDAPKSRKGQKSGQPTADEEKLQPETPKRKRGRTKKTPLSESAVEESSPGQGETLSESVAAKKSPDAAEEAEFSVTEQLMFPIEKPVQEPEAAVEESLPVAEESSPEGEPAVVEQLPTAEEATSEMDAALTEQTPEEPIVEPEAEETAEMEAPVAEPELTLPEQPATETEAAIEESLFVAEETAAEPETSAEAEPVVMEQPAIAEDSMPETEDSVPEAEAVLPEQAEMEEPVAEPEAVVEESLSVAEEPASEPEDPVTEQGEISPEAAEETELTETEEVPSETLSVDSDETVEPPAEEPAAVEEPVSEEEPAAQEEPAVTQEAAPAEDQGEVTLKYDMDSGKRYVDETSQKTDFEKMLDELAKISKDMLSWEVEKFTDRFTKKYVAEGMTLEEANSQKYEAFLGGFITNAAMELYDRGYEEAAIHKLEQAISVLEARKKLETEVDSIKARQEEDVVDLSDMLGLFDGD